MKSLVALLTFLTTSLSFASTPVCRVVMVDSLNNNTTVLETKTLSDGSYSVLDHALSAQPETVNVRFDGHTGKLMANAGVPAFTVQEILTRYNHIKAFNAEKPLTRVIYQDSQLTWILLDGSSCTEMETSLIEFMVMEWFYFG